MTMPTVIGWVEYYTGTKSFEIIKNQKYLRKQVGSGMVFYTCVLALMGWIVTL